MKKVLSWLQKVENSILVATFMVMVIASFAQVVNRNIVKAGISWFGELACYCMIYMALLAAEAGLRDGTQISITAVTDRMKVTIRKFVLLIAKLVVIVFSVIIFVNTYRLLHVQISSGELTPGLEIPMFVPFLAFPLSFAIIILVQVTMFIKMIMDLFNKEETIEEVKL